MAGWIIWLLLLAAAALLEILTQSALSLAVLAAAALLPLLAIGLAALGARRVTLTMPPLDAAEKGRQFTLRLHAENSGLLPQPRIAVCLRCENLLTGEQTDLRLRLAAPAHGTGETCAALESDWCGMLRMQVLSARACDLFGLAGFRVAAPEAFQLPILPQTFEPRVNLPLLAGRSEDSEVYSMERPGRDCSETFQIRDYRDGDSPRQIHWKLSGKMDRMIVRDPSLPLERSVLLLWERRAEAQSPAQSDALCESLVSVLRALLALGVSCRVAWTDPDAQGCARCELREEAELYALLPRLLSAAPQPEAEPLAARYVRLYGSETGAQTLYFAPQPDPMLSELCPEDRLLQILAQPQPEEPALGRAICFVPGEEAAALSEIDLY